MPVIVMMAMLAGAMLTPEENPRPHLVAGTELELMVMTEITAANAKAGDPVKLRLNRPLAIDGVTIIPAGVPAFGEVVTLSKSGMAMKRGTLSVRLLRLVVNGRDVPLDGELDAKGRGGKSDDALKVVLAPIYAPFARGNSAKFKAGELVVGHLAGDYVAQ